jgi:hypothetical protein
MRTFVKKAAMRKLCKKNPPMITLCKIKKQWEPDDNISHGSWQSNLKMSTLKLFAFLIPY